MNETTAGRPLLGSKWRHKARGSEYEIIGEAEMQIAREDLVDGSEVVIYRGEDGKLWVRQIDEFLDGRFERLGDD